MDDDLSPSRLHHKIDGKNNNLIAYILVAFLYVLQKLMKRKFFAEISGNGFKS